MKKKLYYERFNILFIISILVRFLPFFIRQLYITLFRDPIPGVDMKTDRLSFSDWIYHSLYDSVYSMILFNSNDPSSPSFNKKSMHLIYLLRQIASSIDGDLEALLVKDEYMGMENLLDSSRTQYYLEYLKKFQEYHQSPVDILDYSNRLLHEQMDGYIAQCKTAGTTYSVNDILECNDQDSGGWMVYLKEIIYLFNGINGYGAKDNGTLHALGMAGKLADEMIDIKRDIKDSDPNLFYAILKKYPEEKNVFIRNFSNHRTLSSRWLKKHCPKSLDEFFEIVEDYYKKIDSGRMRLACHLMFLPVIIGIDYETLKKS